MPFSGYLTLAHGDTLTHTHWNTLRDAIKTSFDHGITNADLTWPLRLQGPIDFSDWTLKNLTTVGTIIFADKYASLQAAINAAHANGGGIVLMGPRTYSFSATLDMQNGNSSNHNVQLIGCGAATVLQPLVPFTGTEIIRVSNSTASPAQRMVLSNFKIDGTTARVGGATCNGIDTRCSEDTVISNLYLEDMPAKGIVLDRSRRMICEHNIIELGTDNTGISLTAQRAGDEQVIVRHNIVSGMSGNAQAYYIQCILPSDSVISNNYIRIDQLNKTGIHVTTNGATAINNVVVARNTVIGISAGQTAMNPADTSGRGITIETPGNTAVSATGFEVMNNFVYAVGQDGIQIVAADSPGTGVLQNFSVCGNIVQFVGRHGIRIRNASKFGAVFGNIVRSPNGLNTSGRGISMSQTAAGMRPTYISFVGNCFTWHSQDHTYQPTLAIEGSANVGSCLINGNAASGFSTASPWSLPAGLGNQLGVNIPV